MAVADYLRCPGCGHIHATKGDVLPPQISELHEFQVLVKKWGGDTPDGKIVWGEREITLEELRALLVAEEKIVERLKTAVEESE